MYLFAWLFLFLAGAFCIFVFFGSFKTPFAEILKALAFCGDNESISTLLWQIRIPRFLLAVLCGAMLSVAGAIMQTLFRNPLADPSITGVSAGAALGAVVYLCIVPQFFMGLQVFAFIFGIAAFAAVYKLGRIDNNVSPYSLLLAGIAINAFCSALVAFFMYSARDMGVRGIVFWSLGSLNFASLNEILPAYILCILVFAYAIKKSNELNILLLGANQAYCAGVNVGRLQFLMASAAALATSVCVSLCGTIGFVGLVVPHIIRQLIGPNNKPLIMLSAMAGAVLICYADILSRIINANDPMPIGVITAFIGAPFFAYILRKCSK